MGSVAQTCCVILSNIMRDDARAGGDRHLVGRQRSRHHEERSLLKAAPPRTDPVSIHQLPVPTAGSAQTASAG